MKKSFIRNCVLATSLAFSTFGSIADTAVTFKKKLSWLNELKLQSSMYSQANEKFELLDGYANKAVFQQGKPISISGNAEPNTLVAARLINDVSQASEANYVIVNSSGQWTVTLPAQPASLDSYTIKISDGTHQSKLNNVLIGEVWKYDGSDIFLPNGDVEFSEEEINNRLDYVRIFKIKTTKSTGDQDAKWKRVKAKPEYKNDENALAVLLYKRFIELGESSPVAVIKENADILGFATSDLPFSIVEQEPHPLIEYLKQIQGVETIVGVHNDEKVQINEPSQWTNEVAKVAQVWPSLWSYDFGYNASGIALRENLVKEAYKHWQQGMVLNIMLHVCPPTVEEGCDWNQGEGGMLSDLSLEQWQELLSRGTSLQGAWLSRLDLYASYLSELQDLGVHVLLRPFHEMNQTLFWWSLDGYPEFTTELYRLTHDYLVETKGLKNLAFIWDLQDFETLESDLNDYDPGEEYWDVLALDIYGVDRDGSLSQWQLFDNEKYDLIANKAGDKPIAIGESAKLPTAGILAEQPLWTFAMSWSELTFEENTEGAIKSLYSAQNVVQLNDMPGWTATPKVVYEIPEANLDQGEKLVIFSDQLGQWRLPSASLSQIVESVVVDEDSFYGNVVEYEYADNHVVGEFRSETLVDISEFVGGTLEFDLKVLAESEAIDGNWYIKVDCGWPCGTADIPLYESIEGLKPTVGYWQHFTFSVDELIANGTLDPTKVLSPLVIFPLWGEQQQGAKFRIDNIAYHAAPAIPVFELLTNDDYSFTARTSQFDEVRVSDVGSITTDVREITFLENQSVSAFTSGEVIDLSVYAAGTLEFDLKVVTLPQSADGNWYMKMECGWPCGTGDVPLTSSREGVMPIVGQWQHYTFDMDYLTSLPGSHDQGAMPLNLTKVSSLLTLFPTWGNSQQGTVYRIENIIFKPAGSNAEKPNELTDTISREFNLNGIDFSLPTKPLKLHSLISDNALFQQGKVIRLFGQAEANTIVLAKLGNNLNPNEIFYGHVVVPETGIWELELPALQGSYDTYTLKVSDTVNEKQVNNIQVGEVWVIAGQSNMELKISQMVGAQELMDSINNSNVRIFHQNVSDGNYNFPYKPQFDVLGGNWTTAETGSGIADSSAIGATFALKMVDEFNQIGEQIPVAIINAHRGGSKIQAWLPRETVLESSEISAYVSSQQNQYVPDKYFTVADQLDWNSHGWDNYVQTSALFNQKVSPLTRFNIKGLVWYQGESDPVYEANVYNIKALIDSWSALFNRNEELLDVALIQLAPYNGQDPFSGESTNYGNYSGFADHRQAQQAVVADQKYTEKVRLIPIHDIPLDWETDIEIFAYKDPIHPLAKLPIGERLADVMFNSVYQYNDQYLAPRIDSIVREGGSLLLNFDREVTLMANTATVQTLKIGNKIGQYWDVSAEFWTNTTLAINELDIASKGISVEDVYYISYADLSRNEQGNLVSDYGIPALPFVQKLDRNPHYTVSPLLIFADKVTSWSLPSTNQAVTQSVVVDDIERGNVLEHTYIANGAVSDLLSPFNSDLSDYAGGTLEFDLKLIQQAEGASGNWFIKVDCGWPCGTGDVPFLNSVEGVQPQLSQWQHYTFPIDELLALAGSNDVGALPLNLANVVSPLTVFPQWGDNQAGTIYRIDNIVYYPANYVKQSNESLFVDNFTDLSKANAFDAGNLVIENGNAQYFFGDNDRLKRWGDYASSLDYVFEQSMKRVELITYFEAETNNDNHFVIEVAESSGLSNRIILSPVIEEVLASGWVKVTYNAELPVGNFTYLRISFPQHGVSGKDWAPQIGSLKVLHN
ncbi:glycosyl hydrolase [Thalassotalea agariperforans]